jgi:transposase-like protein
MNIGQSWNPTRGFTSQGRREVLDWRVGDSESQECWGEVFRSLKDRKTKNGRGTLLLIAAA